MHIITKTSNIEALELFYNHVTGDVTDHSVHTNLMTSAVDSNGLTVFHLAAQVGSHEVLEYLLNKSKLHNVSTKSLLANLCTDKRSPLNYAVEHCHMACIAVLLKYGGDPTRLNGCRPPPLHLAVWHGNLEAIKLMVSACGKEILQSQDQNGHTVLQSSTSIICNKALISYLVENGARINDVGDNGDSALSTAVNLGSVEAVSELLRLGADPLVQDKLGNNSLHRAVLGRKLEVFHSIISCSSVAALASTANNKGNYPIHLALKEGIQDMVSALIEKTSESFRDAEGSNYVHLAALSCNEKCLACVLDAPDASLMINEANDEGLTPLHYAAMGSSLTSVRQLIDHRAEIHRDHSGLTPFMCACSKGNLEIAQLLYREFQRDWFDHHGCTALHAAVDGGNHQLITFCLDKGMAITLNKDAMSFLDKIVDRNDKKLAKTVVTHKRWAECIDIHCPSKPHPILRILDHMPDVYGIILDNCHTKSPLSPVHLDYWEEFDFRCLDLKPVEPPNTTREDNSEEMNAHDASRETLEMTKVQNSFSKYEFEFAPVGVQRSRDENISGQTKLSAILSAKRGHSLAVVRGLIKMHHSPYLLHPVVAAYIKMKWDGFGFVIQTATMLTHFLLALIFSVFLALLPLPSQSPDLPFNTSNSSTDADTFSFNSGTEALLYLSLVMAILNLGVFLIKFTVIESTLSFTLGKKFRHCRISWLLHA